MKNKATAEEVLYWYDWFFDHTESFEPFAIELAYLWPAMLRGDGIDIQESGELYRFLMDFVQAGVLPREANLWQYLYFIDNETSIRKSLQKP